MEIKHKLAIAEVASFILGADLILLENNPLGWLFIVLGLLCWFRFNQKRREATKE